MRLLREHLGKEVGLRTVDIFAGLNVLVLLLELQRYFRARSINQGVESLFISLQESDSHISRDDKMLQLIYRVDSYRRGAFAAIIGAFFHNVDCRKVNLVGVDLRDMNLCSTDLTSAFLFGSDLRGVNLQSAILTDANLDNAFLSNSNLRNAKLRNASLRNVFLDGVDLRGADLSQANLSGATFWSKSSFPSLLRPTKWNEETNWEGVKGIETAKRVPIALKQQLGLE